MVIEHVVGDGVGQSFNLYNGILVVIVGDAFDKVEIVRGGVW